MTPFVLHTTMIPKVLVHKVINSMYRCIFLYILAAEIAHKVRALFASSVPGVRYEEREMYGSSWVGGMCLEPVNRSRASFGWMSKL